MIKVIHVSGSNVWGGNEQQIIDLLKSLNKEKVKNYLYTIKGSKLLNLIDLTTRIEFAKVDKLNSLKNCRSFYNAG